MIDYPEVAEKNPFIHYAVQYDNNDKSFILLARYGTLELRRNIPVEDVCNMHVSLRRHHLNTQWNEMTAELYKMKEIEDAANTSGT